MQQLSTGGGQPIYLLTGRLPAAFTFAGHGSVLGVPFVLIATLVCLAGFAVTLGATPFGRRLMAQGAQRGVAWYSGLPIRRDAARACLLGALVCGIAGVLLSCTVRAYVPLFGWNYYWQQVGTGVLIFLVLAASFAGFGQAKRVRA